MPWVIALTALGLGSCSGPTGTVTKLMEDNATATQYTDKEVTADRIQTLVTAGQSVPSVRNVSQWQYIAVGGNKISRLAGIKTLGGGIANAKAAIVICGLTRRMNGGEARDMWQQDCAAATQNIMLTARSMGMTPNWVRVYPVKQRVAEVSAALDLDPGVIPFSIIALGYADDENLQVATPAKQPELITIGTFED